MARIKITIALVMALAVISVSGQRVGVVLSGGGAKGLYHIGVLKALEENGIPVDYISGTSMGAIVAGLYAIGYTPQEMWDIFRSDRVSYWMSGKIEDRYHFYFKQPRPTASMINLRLDVKKPERIRIPTNIIPSRQIDMAFVEFFSGANARSGGDFNNLFVPFRCVATDMVKRREVVFRDGDMGKAIRASMTIPFVFSALKQDSAMFYDGGIYNNFPWQVLEQDFAPDILIGSKCTDGNVVPKEDNLMDQVFALTMMHTDYDLPSSNDILIENAFNDVSMLDFAKVDYVVSKGYEDALNMMPVIKERIARRADSVELAAKRLEYRASEPELVFDNYEITGMDKDQKTYMDRMLRLKNRNGQTGDFTFDKFRSEYFRLLTEGDITCDYPDVTYNDVTGHYSLLLNASSKPSLKLMFGGNISSTSMNQAYVGLEYKTVRLRSHTFALDGYFSALYTSVQARGRTDFFMKFPLALDYAYNYNYYNYFRSNFGKIAKANDLSYTKYSDSYFTTALSTPLDRLSVLSLRLNLGDDNYRYYQRPNYSDEDAMDRTRFRFGGVRLEADRNDLNYVMYPTRGIRQNASAAFIIGREYYTPGSFAPPEANTNVAATRRWFAGYFSREHYFSFAKWFSAGYLVEGIISNHPDFSNDYATNITAPAFTPTPHSKSVYLKDFRSSSYAAVGVMPTFEFAPRLYLKNGIYAFVPMSSNAVGNDNSNRVRMMFSSIAVYQTPVGAISLALSKYNARANNNWFLTFNFGYTIFNRKGLFY